MNMRKTTSLTALLSFILLMITIVVLYIVPQGRVAYWADWHLWEMGKEKWGNLHINFGLLFLLSVFLHVLRGLKENKLIATSDMSIKTLAVKHQMNPIDVYEMIRQASSGS